MSRHTMPLARTTDLNVESVGDETLVFDRKTDKAYVLNSTAAEVWRACNGQRSASDISIYLSQDTLTTEHTVWFALGQLNDLLEEPVPLPQELVGVSRRKFLKMSGAVAAGVAIPLVVTMVAPSAASAQSATGVTCCFYFCSGFPQAECLDPAQPCPAKPGCSLSQETPGPDCSFCAGG